MATSRLSRGEEIIDPCALVEALDTERSLWWGNKGAVSTAFLEQLPWAVLKEGVRKGRFFEVQREEER